mgnify:CR=1 FL=1
MKVRTRFAPSPTGYLHVGGLRTALYNYLYAKQNNGKFILRIEDTDQNRLVEFGVENLIENLKKINLNYDIGPYKEDSHGPYIQSQRLDIYKKHYMHLIKNESAYLCFNEKDQLIPEYNVNKALLRIKNESFVVKLKVKSDKKMIINDLIRGNIEFDLKLIDDPIIIKSDGYPTYHFANVVDDYLMKITHVIRGEEWISSLPKHVILYKAFQWTMPEFCHLPLLLNPDKSKLSKRQGDVSVEEFFNNGYLKDSLINFVSLLGWHPENNQEIFSIDDLIKLFSIERINKSGAIFDRDKLNWMNKEYIKNIASKKFQKIINQVLINHNVQNTNIDIVKIANYCKERITTLNQIWDEIKCFYLSPDFNRDELNDFDYKNLFLLWATSLDSTDAISKEEINLIIQNSKKSLNIYGKNLFIPLRLVLIGQAHGPDLFTVINILGIKETIKRIQTQ